jgi:hypothetical protein
MTGEEAVKSATDIREFVRTRIGYVYERPLMYADRVESLDTLLHFYHELIQYIDECSRNELLEAMESVQKAIGCPGAKSFGQFCRENAAGKSEQDLATEIVDLWKQVDRELNTINNLAT